MRVLNVQFGSKSLRLLFINAGIVIPRKGIDIALFLRWFIEGELRRFKIPLQ